MGFIQRDTRQGVPVKWGTTTPLQEYDDAKGFIASFAGVSAKLVNVGGNEYRAQVDQGFLKFKFVTTNTTNEKNYWLVTDRSGNKYYLATQVKRPTLQWKPNWPAQERVRAVTTGPSAGHCAKS